jgi:hypothetical protein
MARGTFTGVRTPYQRKHAAASRENRVAGRVSYVIATFLTMDTTSTALLISMLSLALAGTSLGWQILQWLLSAGRAKATLLHGIMQGTASYSGPVKDGKLHDLSSLRRQGFGGEEVVGIRVVNHGRAPVTIGRIVVHARGGRVTLNPVGDLIGAPLPHVLEPGTNENWYVAAADAIRLVTSSREILNDSVSGIYMTAELGTGKVVRTHELLRI